MSIVDQLKAKYPNHLAPGIPSVDLMAKWKTLVPPGWYGFSGLPEAWTGIIDEYLTWVARNVRLLEIHQIKLKFGGLRCYIDYTRFNDKGDDMICISMNEIEDWLFDKSLVY